MDILHAWSEFKILVFPVRGREVFELAWTVGIFSINGRIPADPQPELFRVHRSS